MRGFSSVQSVSFNQDFGCFACGLESGFRLFNVDPLKSTYGEKLDGGIAKVEMLFRCNYVALIGNGTKASFPSNAVVVWDIANRSEVTRIEMNADVNGVRLRRDRIVIILETKIHVFSFTDSPSQLHVFDTSQNPRAICCLCPSSNNSLLVFPSPTSPSVVMCVNLADPDAPAKTITAHMRPLATIALNSDANYLLQLNQFLFSLNFSPDSSMLCVSSNHNTVHLFDLNDEEKRKKTPLRRLTLPGSVSFSRFQLPFSTKKNEQCICAFSSQAESVIAISSNGCYCKFNFDRNHGDCMRQTCVIYLEMNE
ncbi:unnamed protein product [Anisakis simplex]|uniref:WD repeat domain phosphoinositide-interacting protein 3 n=1 Tax=Anisakis simplex TaxID=6269 RepID=A0A0M3JX46_ANISI|nr:unnamed protein product [Anisakis simplex]